MFIATTEKMWNPPTHLQVLIKTAKGLKIKGKDGTNDAYATIDLGRQKYQTSVKHKTKEVAEWCEKCELKIPRKNHDIVLTVYHQTALANPDQFLGTVSIPLSSDNVSDSDNTLSAWYPLRCKPGQTKLDYRGEIEVSIAFCLGTRHSGSQSSLTGSSISLSSSKFSRNSSLSLAPSSHKQSCFWGKHSEQNGGNDMGCDNSQNPSRRKVTKSNLLDLEQDTSGYLDGILWSDSPNYMNGRSMPPNGQKEIKMTLPRNHKDANRHRKDSKGIREKFKGVSKDNMIEIIIQMHGRIEGHRQREKDLEDYIDSLLLKVLSLAPDILEKGDDDGDGNQ